MFSKIARVTFLSAAIGLPTIWIDAVQTEAHAQRQSIGEMRRNMQRRAEENRAFHRRNESQYQQWRSSRPPVSFDRRSQPHRGAPGKSR